MSLLYSVVFSSRCTSNHHRLAVDALRHLKTKRAEDWRNLFLHFHDDYLKGAKAPDNVFKDFKNHVLHVRDGDWGGAPEAATEWQGRTVSALQEKDWKQAAWCAGVMSHYYVDPIQPFHTHQTEEEGVIHAAVERSFSKAYKTFQAIIENDLGGYPEVQVPNAPDWMSQMVRLGARQSNPHYELVLDHFNHTASLKNPEAGLDQELKDTIAGLVAYAAAGFAAVLDRTIEEAAVKPPVVDTTLDAVFAGMQMPIKALLAGIEDGQDRKFVEAQYNEFRKTGKVRETLRDDDRAVRALYADEVMHVQLSSLDAKWPRKTGTQNGQGAPARVTSKKGAGAPPPSRKKTKRAQPEPRPARVAAPPPSVAPPIAPPAPQPETRRRTRAAEPPPVTQTVASPPIAPPVEEPLPLVEPIIETPLAAAAAAQVAATTPPEPPPPPQPDPEAPAKRARAAKEPPIQLLTAFTLDAESSVEEAPSIGPKTARRLEAVGVRTVGDLLALSPAAGAVLINQKHISAEVIHDWQSQALLACTVAGLKSREAQALVACGIRSAEDLAGREAPELTQELTEWARSPQAERAWGKAAPPAETDVVQWIARAKGVMKKTAAA